jgi:cytochrome c oxidase subunit 3
MGLFSKVTEMPWLDQGLPEEGAQTGEFATSPTKVSLIVFLAVVTSIFFLFFMAYLERMELNDWYPLEEPFMLWINTAFLVFASFAMQSARKNVEKENGSFKLTLIAGGGFALAFLVGQYMAWEELRAAGLYAATNPANAFFYTLTAMHGLHLLGGLYVWLRTVIRNQRGAERSVVSHSIELCSVYWHYLLLLWLMLFALMLNT